MVNLLFKQMRSVIASLLVLGLVFSLAPMGYVANAATTCPSVASVQALPGLKKGMTSTAVKTLQTALMCLGYTISSATGYYGTQTTAAVLAFYTAHNSAAGVALGGGTFGPAGRSLLASDVSAKLGTPSGTDNSALIAVLLALKASNPSMAAVIDALIASLSTSTVTPASDKLSVTLDSTNPVGGSIVADSTNGGEARRAVLALRFSNGSSSSVSVTSLKITRTGLSSDSDLDNAYLYDTNGNKIADMSSFSSGVITFTGSPLVSVPANGTAVVMVKIDLNKGASSGKTLVFQVASAANVVSTGDESGTFPLGGNTFTVATVSDLAQLRVATTSMTTTVDPGTSNFAAMKFQLIVSNQPVKVGMIKFKQLGSVASGDVSNPTLWDGSTKLADGVVTSDGYIVFTLADYSINSGLTRNLELHIDVLGGANRTIQYSILMSSDVTAWDKTYNVSIRPHTGTVGTFSAQSGNSVTVNQGSLVVTKDTASAVGNVVLNGTNVSLGKFVVAVYGEPIKVNTLTVKVASSTGTSWTNIKNVRVLLNGAQVGTTQTTVTNNSNTALTTNFIAPVGTSSLEIFADIQSASGTALDGSSTILATVVAGSNNAIRQNSNLTASFPGANVPANVLTVQAGSLGAVTNPSLAAGTASIPTAVVGQTAVRVGSWVLTAGPEAVNISTFPFTDNSSAFGKLQNLYMKFNGTQFGNVQAALTAGQTYNFTGNTVQVLANGQAVVDAYADVQSGAAAGSSGNVQLNAISGTGAYSSQAANSSNQAGQTVYIASSGTLTSFALDASSPSTRIIVMGKTGLELARFKLDASTSSENLAVTSITITDNTSDTGGIYNIKLINADTGAQIGSTVIALNGSAQAVFDLTANPLTITKNTVLKIKVVSDTNSFPTAANATHAISVDINKIAYRGAISQQTATTPSSTTTAGTMTLRRSKLTVNSFTAQGGTTARVRGANDDLARLVVAADSGADVLVTTTTFTVSGSALNTTATQTATFQLVDALDGTKLATTSVSYSSSTQSFTVSINPPTATNDLKTVSAGQTRTYKVLLDSTNFNSTANASLSIQIASTGSVHWQVINDTTDNSVDNTGILFPSTLTFSYQ